MTLRFFAVTLLLLPLACAVPKPARSATVIPLEPIFEPIFEPVVTPKPVALPAPVAATPPVPLVTHPVAQTPPGNAQPAPQSQQHPDKKPEQAVAPKPANEKSPPGKGPPPPPVTWKDRPECKPQPVKPHLGGDGIHNTCADTFPPNRFPGHDVLVGGKRFDALQVDENVLWEIKTDRFDTYSLFLRDRVVKAQELELKRELEIAKACGYDFKVGVSSPAHRDALIKLLPKLTVVVTGC